MIYLNQNFDMLYLGCFLLMGTRNKMTRCHIEKHLGSKAFQSMCSILFWSRNILRGTRNLSYVLRRSLLRSLETIWILVISIECSNIAASKSIRRERKLRPMELSGVNFSTHGSESE